MRSSKDPPSPDRWALGNGRRQARPTMVLLGPRPGGDDGCTLRQLLCQVLGEGFLEATAKLGVSIGRRVGGQVGKGAQGKTTEKPRSQ